MPSELSLPRLQRWMQSVIVHPGAAEEAVSSPEAQAELPLALLPEVILPSKTLTSTERVSIYHGMYLPRMEEALQTDYPALRHFLGGAGFRELVRGYVQAHPSRSYTFNRLGDHLPEYVREAPGLKRRAFCHDLARLELAISQVFDAAETPPLSEEDLAGASSWERARLRPVEAFRLLAFRYPVSGYVQSVRDEDHDHPAPRRKDTWVAVHRRDYQVRRQDLTRPAHDLLLDLASGVPLGQAVASALRRPGGRAPREEELFGWFKEWVAGGVFRSLGN